MCQSEFQEVCPKFIFSAVRQRSFYHTLTVNEQWTESDFGGPDGSAVKNPPANAGDTGLIPGLGRSPGGGNDNPLQYSCLENSREEPSPILSVHGHTRFKAKRFKGTSKTPKKEFPFT